MNLFRNSLNGKKKLKIMVRMMMLVMKLQLNSPDFAVRAKAILFKSIHHRTTEDIKLIVKFMLRLDFFQKLKREQGILVVEEVCRYLYFRRVEDEQEVIHIDEEGKTFYVILSGVVSIIVYRPKNDQIAQRLKVKEILQNSLLKRHQKNPEDILINFDDETQFEKEKIRTLSQGDSFGEYSLLDYSNRTTATIVTKSTCEFSCLDRAEYWEIIGRIKKNEVEEKLKVIKNLNIFSEWGQYDINTISYHFEIEKISKGNCVIKEGEQNQFLYFVCSGHFRVNKILHTQEKQDIQHYKQTKINNSITISTLGPGEMFGQEGFVGHKYNLFSIYCSSDTGQVYKISYEIIQKRLWEQNQKKRFYQMISNFLQFRVERFETLKKEELDNKIQIGVTKIEQDISKMHLKSLAQINHLKTLEERANSPYQLRIKKVLEKKKNLQLVRVPKSVSQTQNNLNTQSNYHRNHSSAKFYLIRVSLMTVENLDLLLKTPSLHGSRYSSTEKSFSEEKRYNKRGTLIIPTHIVLKRGKIQRFIKNNDVVEGPYIFNDPNRVDVVPRITMHRKPIQIDSMNAVNDFATLDQYQLKVKKLELDVVKRMPQIKSMSPNKTFELGNYRKLTRQNSVEIELVNPVHFMKFVSKFKNEAANEFGHNLLKFFYSEENNNYIKTILEFTQQMETGSIFEILRFYLVLLQRSLVYINDQSQLDQLYNQLERFRPFYIQVIGKENYIIHVYIQEIQYMKENINQLEKKIHKISLGFQNKETSFYFK